jgi:hypothetical protein
LSGATSTYSQEGYVMAQNRFLLGVTSFALLLPLAPVAAGFTPGEGDIIGLLLDPTDAEIQRWHFSCRQGSATTAPMPASVSLEIIDSDGIRRGALEQIECPSNGGFNTVTVRPVAVGNGSANLFISDESGNVAEVAGLHSDDLDRVEFGANWQCAPGRSCPKAIRVRSIVMGADGGTRTGSDKKSAGEALDAITEIITEEVSTNETQRWHFSCRDRLGKASHMPAPLAVEIIDREGTRRGVVDQIECPANGGFNTVTVVPVPVGVGQVNLFISDDSGSVTEVTGLTSDDLGRVAFGAGWRCASGMSCPNTLRVRRTVVKTDGATATAIVDVEIHGALNTPHSL